MPKALYLLFFILSFSSPSLAEKWQSSAFILNSFYEVALGSEYGEGGYRIRKWTKPIRIFVYHKVGNKELLDKLLNMHIKQLRQITGLDIKQVYSREESNFDYYFTSQKNLFKLVEDTAGASTAEHLNGSVCIASVRTNGKGSITNAWVYIPVDLARMHGKLVSCIVEELTQALGLVRDSDLVYPSIFNDKTYNELLTGLDETLLRILSDAEVEPGMTQNQLDPIVKKIIARYQKNGTIKSATKRVMQGELYPLLGYR